MREQLFFFAARQAGVPVIQIRAVSNYVEKRNRDNWQIDTAVTNLNGWLIRFLEKINGQGYAAPPPVV